MRHDRNVGVRLQPCHAGKVIARHRLSGEVDAIGGDSGDPGQCLVGRVGLDILDPLSRRRPGRLAHGLDDSGIAFDAAAQLAADRLNVGLKHPLDQKSDRAC